MTVQPARSSRRHERARRPMPVVTSTRTHSPLLPFALLSAVFMLKLAVMLELKDHVLTQPDAGLDTTAYVELARRVLDGDLALGPGLYFLSPLYIYFLAVVLAIRNSFTAVRLVQIALGTAAVALVYVAADAWFGRRAAWLAAALATLTGLFTFYESLLLQAALDPFLTAAALACLALALKQERWRWYVLTGLAFGVQTCNRPNVAVPAAAVALLLFVAGRRRAAALLVGGMALALAPVTLRNVVAAGDWSPVASSHGGLNFYIGNNPEADGTYRAVAGITPNIKGQQEDTRRVAERATGRPLDDAAVSSYFYGLSRAWMREHPMSAAALFLRKLSLMFSAGYVWLNYSFPFFAFDARTLLRVLLVGPWLLIPLGIIGLVVAAPKAGLPGYFIWASFVPIYAVAVALFYVTDRYQLPMLVPLCAGGGAAIDALVTGVSSKRWRPLAMTAVAFAALFAWANRPLGLDDGVVEERIRMAERLVTLGRYAEAEDWAGRAEQGNPHPGVVHFRLGQRLVASDRSAAATAHFEKALELDPGQVIAAYALGETLLDAGRPREAVSHLRRALDAGVRVDQTGYDLVRALGASGDREGATRVLQQVRPARDDDEERWTALGQLAIQLREPQLAEMFCRKALTVRPGFEPALARLGRALNIAGRWADAARELEAAIRIDPRDADAQVDLALADLRLGRVQDSRLHAEAALGLEPGSERARQLLLQARD